MRQRTLSAAIFVMTILIGIIAFLYPFWLPVVGQTSLTGQSHAADSPLMLTLLVPAAVALFSDADLTMTAAPREPIALLHLGLLMALAAGLEGRDWRDLTKDEKDSLRSAVRERR